MELSPGTKVTDNVTLVRLLGEGGMGSVWVAEHRSLQVEVAVKFISPKLAELDPSLLTRFKREASLAAKIKSPHVVKTFDHGVMEGGRSYIVMELLAGETLGERLARGELLSLRQSSIVLTQVAQVLTEAHSLGVVHRDIKPDNVFLMDSGYELFVKVLDFGIAKQTKVPAVHEVTSTGSIVGTPEYMSPEQLLSTKSADFRADLWALGVLAYHGLTGRVPFEGETLPSLSIAICASRFKQPSELLDDVPGDLDDWFDRAFAPKPEGRFASVGLMAETFAEIAGYSMDLKVSSSKSGANAATEPMPDGDKLKLASGAPSGAPSSGTATDRDGGTMAAARRRNVDDSPAGAVLVRVEEAASLQSSELEPPEQAHESGKRRGSRGQIARAKTLVTGEPPPPARSSAAGRIKLALIGAAVAAAVIIGTVVMCEPPAREVTGNVVTAAASSAAAGAIVTASAPTPSETTGAAQPPPSAAGTAPAAGSAGGSASAPTTAAAPSPPQPTNIVRTTSRPTSTASAKVKPSCYYTDSEGNLAIKPECL